MANNEETAKLQARIGALTDRVQLLENNLERTQEKVRFDMNKLLQLFQDLSKDSGVNRQRSGTYRGP